MLILTRREAESILIGDSIRITILQTGKQCRIGIEAPRELKILRDELVSIDPADEPASDDR